MCIRSQRIGRFLVLFGAEVHDRGKFFAALELAQDFDYIVCDSPAGIEQGFRYAVAPADEVLIITNPEVAAVRDADRVVGLVEAEEKGPARLIVNRITTIWWPSANSQIHWKPGRWQRQP